MTTSPEANPYPTAQKIWDVLLELHSQEQVITRELLRDLTGLRLQIVDDHVGRMIEKGQLRRLRAGVFALEPQYPAARPISVTVLADGCAKVEIGDLCLELWPKERRMLAGLLVGDAVQLSNIQTGHDVNFLVNSVWEELKKLKRDLGEP
ncbi:hypothetical protein [Delftia acidovorans]|uniref:hypothetical protein n=1 Tax=Delftia acidovorans TaxID=80866 RepID=UPI00333E3E16